MIRSLIASCLLAGCLLCLCPLAGEAALAGGSECHQKRGLITAVEDASSEPSGFYVATSENNYVLYTPKPPTGDWLSVSVNDNHVSIITAANQTIQTNIANLDEETRERLTKMRLRFTDCLGDVYLSSQEAPTLPSSRSRAYLGPPPLQRTQGSYGHQAGVYYAQTQQHHHHQHQRYQWQQPPRRAPLRLVAPLVYGARPSTGIGRPALVPSPPPSLEPKGEESCELEGTLNYYNLHNSPLAHKLPGDIYHFDEFGAILDIYSSTVSICKQGPLAAIYRGPDYYSAAHARFPLNVNRLFKSGNHFIFVYNDGRLSIRSLAQLSPSERRLVSQVRSLLARKTALRIRDSSFSSHTLDEGAADSSPNDDLSSEEEEEEEPEQQLDDSQSRVAAESEDGAGGTAAAVTPAKRAPERANNGPEQQVAGGEGKQSEQVPEENTREHSISAGQVSSTERPAAAEARDSQPEAVGANPSEQQLAGPTSTQSASTSAPKAVGKLNETTGSTGGGGSGSETDEVISSFAAAEEAWDRAKSIAAR